jgi:hypothetical protein
MSKNFLVIFLIIFLGLSAVIVYAYSPKSINGHTWSEMECSGVICVTPENKVGIGTDSPMEKLQINGNVLVSGDACISAGYCLSDLDIFE